MSKLTKIANFLHKLPYIINIVISFYLGFFLYSPFAKILALFSKNSPGRKPISYTLVLFFAAYFIPIYLYQKFVIKRNETLTYVLTIAGPIVAAIVFVIVECFVKKGGCIDIL